MSRPKRSAKFGKERWDGTTVVAFWGPIFGGHGLSAPCEWRQPSDFELAPDDDQHVGPLQLEDEARLRLDEMRVLIALRQRLDGGAIAANLARDRREILGRRDDVQLPLRARRQRREHGD